MESTKSATKAFKAKGHGGCTASHMRGVVSKALEGNDVGLNAITVIHISIAIYLF